jgi:hypothetical protein
MMMHQNIGGGACLAASAGYKKHEVVKRRPLESGLKSREETPKTGMR